MKNVTTETFKDEVLESKKPVIVDLWAGWCSPCRMLAPIFEEFAEQNNDVEFVKLNADENPEILQKYNITGIPTMLRFENGKITHKQVGFVGKMMLKRNLGL